MMKYNTKSIAILLSIYNGSKYIKEQIDSIIRQTNNDWTLYIRDDASIDDTVEIIKEYERANSNIILIEDNLGNLGAHGNFFQLLSSVNSQYYMPCDGDDIWFEDKISISLDRMSEEEKLNPNIPIIVHTDFTICDQDMNVISESYWESRNLNPEKYKSYIGMAMEVVAGGSLMFFNQKVKDISYPLPSKTPIYDYYIPIQTIKTGVIASIYKSTKLYRRHSSNYSEFRLLKSKTILGTIKKRITDYKFISGELENMGWGGFWKFLFYKIVYKIKK